MRASLFVLALLLPSLCLAQTRKVHDIVVTGRNEDVRIINIQDGSHSGKDARVDVGGLTVDEESGSKSKVYIDSNVKDSTIYNKNGAVSIGTVRSK